MVKVNQTAWKDPNYYGTGGERSRLIAWCEGSPEMTGASDEEFAQLDAPSLVPAGSTHYHPTTNT
jgi:hypothetical protein